ncbi:cystathionine beta/gamma-lyase protein [Gregarina niphandrodes]|uniref:Cystathionine beta/gamma-lyase protein n=1 Tax=Gregarina niphandrodes TaxID=110365 RepID=A0A023B787_GRENI|nr:cystathionine beta/gamma-lyase protein [Gregarina niphandrodes]EZG67089.1 cystathionine beta/gamma-lyase protein [Gregarina niphandrodes]|eukprot:XP_011130343.1 cystathionine beta/gamma-lyase protein [Gregarina niphandrodes]
MVEQVMSVPPVLAEEMCVTASPGLTDTLCVEAGERADPVTGAMLTPLYQSTAYKQESVERYQETGYTYSRAANPTVAAFEARVGEMEGAKLPAVVFNSGMAASNALFATFLSSGDHVIITRCSYGGTNRAARVLWQNQFGVEVSFVDFTDLKAVEAAIQPGRTRLVLSETPCNPVLELADLQAISDLCRKHSTVVNQGAVDVQEEGSGPSRTVFQGRILHVADSTLAPPPVMRGLDFGVDVLLVSLTKFYCGHNMHLGGALVTNDPALHEHLKFKQNVMGSILNANTAFSMMQTSKTMNLRLRKQSENAMKIAIWLEKHPKVLWVRYPGLPSHSQYDIAMKQHTHGIHGSMVAFEVRGGTAAGRLVMNACTPPWTLAENLGAIESIMTCPAVFTHSNMTKAAREAAGITDGMIRLSVGIEDADDLIQSLDRAINAVPDLGA